MSKKDRALRFNEGKLKWSLVDFKSLESMVKVLEYGAKKYGKNNWKKGFPQEEIIESMLRHIFAFLNGEKLDKESGLPHTGHIMCNAMFLEFMENKGKNENNYEAIKTTNVIDFFKHERKFYPHLTDKEYKSFFKESISKCKKCKILYWKGCKKRCDCK